MVRMAMSISLDKDTKKTNLNHNNRTMSEAEWIENDHIDKKRLHLNSYLVQEDLKKLYDKEFGEAQKAFNKKQKRADRKIKNYYEHIQKSKRAAVQQEMILQVGDRDDFIDNTDNWNMANEVLEEWFRDFEKRNPNLKIYNAVIHNDESSPHLHINFVPVAGDYQRGMDKQVSFDRAILQQDEKLWEDYKQLQIKIKEENKKRKEKKLKGKYILTAAEMKIDSPFAEWRKKEIAVLEKLLNARGIERVKPGRNGFKDMNEFKMMTDELEAKTKEVEKLTRQLQDIKIQTATELKKFGQAQELNKGIEKEEEKEEESEGLQPIIVPVGYEPMPKVDVQQKKGLRGERYEVDPAQVESLKLWAIDQKEKKEGLKERLKEKDERIRQLIQVARLNDNAIEQRVNVRLDEEKARMVAVQQRDESHMIYLGEQLEASEKRVEALEKENKLLVQWKNHALDFMERIGVRERFNKIVDRVRGSGKHLEK